MTIMGLTTIVRREAMQGMIRRRAPRRSAQDNAGWRYPNGRPFRTSSSSAAGNHQQHSPPPASSWSDGVAAQAIFGSLGGVFILGFGGSALFSFKCALQICIILLNCLSLFSPSLLRFTITTQDISITLGMSPPPPFLDFLTFFLRG